MTRENAIRSLALSVHFRQPSFGMKKYEILSRATAFLLAVDPPHCENDNLQKNKPSAHSHLKEREEERSLKTLKRNYKFEPAGGPSRDAKDLGWLEFCPAESRPLVHVIASSHVLAPWRWKEYYTQEWISHVSQEHCSYSLDVICSTKPGVSLAKFALNPYPIHHPENMDLSIIHLKNENAALNHIMDLGVQTLHLRDTKEDLRKNESFFFTGFEITEDSATDKYDSTTYDNFKDEKENNDARIFRPYTASGSLILFSPNRYIASTPSDDNPALNKPLPQGLCGGPVFDNNDKVCGVVEGIVPLTHSEQNLAGAAAFIPLQSVAGFVKWAEEFMLKQIVPDNLFEKIKKMKAGEDVFPNAYDTGSANETPIANTMGNENRKIRSGQTASPQMSFDESKVVTKELNSLLEEARRRYGSEAVDEMLAVVDQEKKEVIDILKTEGGDMDDVVERVRARTRDKQTKIFEKLETKQRELIRTDRKSVV